MAAAPVVGEMKRRVTASFTLHSMSLAWSVDCKLVTVAVLVESADCKLVTVARSVESSDCKLVTAAVLVESSDCKLVTVAVLVESSDCKLVTVAVAMEEAEEAASRDASSWAWRACSSALALSSDSMVACLLSTSRHRS